MSEKHFTLKQLGFKPYFAQQLTLDDLEQTTAFRVAQVYRNRIVIWGEEGELDLPFTQYQHLPNCTVGDWLLIDHNTKQPQQVLDRMSCFERKSAGTNTQQLIAANVDTAFIVTSCNDDFNLSRIERYLALAKEAQVDVVLILTKADLIDLQQRQDYLSQLQDLQSHLVVLCINALDSNECSQLLDWCGVGQTVVLLGSSGVGKTTISNTLCGMTNKTASIRQDDSKGRHTTTDRALFFTQLGGLILDCPGMRELQLTNCEEGVRAVFADIEQLAQQCKFADCGHLSEPGCAIQAAITNEQLDSRRMKNYQKMLREQSRNTLTIAQAHKKDREFGQLIKSSLKAKQNKYS